MRTIFKLSGFMGISLLIGVVSCSDSDMGSAELSPGAKEYLSMRMGSGNAMSQTMTGPINQSFQNLFGLAFQGGRMAGDSTGVPSDSTGTPSDSTIIDNPWQSCAVITETDNPDGSHTVTYDYGEGCEEGWGDYKYFMHGKYSYTYRYAYEEVGPVYKSSYNYSSYYDNYGGNYGGQWYWLVNGAGSSFGESEYNIETEKFSGFYNYNDESTYEYNSETYTYKGNGVTRYNEKRYVIESSDYEYSTSDDYYYKVNVLEPLVYKYSCYRWNQGTPYDYGCFFWVYVSGREKITYKDGDKEGTFIIDYGDGDCDTIVTIIEEGKITFVDLAKEWNVILK